MNSSYVENWSGVLSGLVVPCLPLAGLSRVYFLLAVTLVESAVQFLSRISWFL